MINILARLVKRELNELQERIDNFTEQEAEKTFYAGQKEAYQKVLHYIEDITGRNMAGNCNSNLFTSGDSKKDLSLDDVIKSLGEGFKKMKDKPTQD